MSDLADALAEWMEAAELERAVFLGNSLRCQTLADFAARYPERTEGLVLQGPTMDAEARSVRQQVWRWLANSQWKELLGKARQWGAFLGVDPEKHPRDFAALVRYHTDMRKISARYPMPGPLALSQLERFLEESGDKYPVRWVDVKSPRSSGTRTSDEEEQGPWLH